jgi:hypothetical protein
MMMMMLMMMVMEKEDWLEETHRDVGYGKDLKLFDVLLEAILLVFGHLDITNLTISRATWVCH